MFFKKLNDFALLDLKTHRGFQKIYERYSTKMYKISLSKTQNEEVTKEIIQEIFKSLWERREQLEINGDIEHYLMRTLKLKIIDHYRAKSALQARKAELTTAEDVLSTNCTEETLVFDELTETISHLMKQLPRQCQNVFRMKYEQSMSNKKIASSLLITERAVAYHLSRAREFLRTELEVTNS
ncbi:MAG: sigma-70 family RNA polymerase sigma factor [Bacteroidota bacterium]